MKVKDISKDLSAELGMSAKEIEEVYKAYWYAVKERIGAEDLYKDLIHHTTPVEREEYLKHDMLFNIEGLGWYGNTYKDYVGACKKAEYAVEAFRKHGIEFDDYGNGKYKIGSGTRRARKRAGIETHKTDVQQAPDDDGLS